jgi:hypothetical protein
MNLMFGLRSHPQDGYTNIAYVYTDIPTSKNI